MDRITSRKNPYIMHLRELAASPEYREEKSEYICDSLKLLIEANESGVEITSVFWKEGHGCTEPEGLSEGIPNFSAPEDLFDYAAPLKNSPGPIFTCRISKKIVRDSPIGNAIVLENVQDPGNVGTVIRTACAFGVDAVILCGTCADLYSPRTVRATMGAVFRQKVFRMRLEEMRNYLTGNGIPLYGAVLSKRAVSIKSVKLSGAAVAVGNEGHGLSGDILKMCDGEIIIPMTGGSESLNAAMAGTVIMWEMTR